MSADRTRHSLGILVAGLAASAGCGRIGFDLAGGAVDASGDAVADATADASGPTGLLLHFAFEADGLTHDRSGSHHDAICSGGCPIVAAGRVGSGAASFATGGCLRIADAPDLRPAAFTYALWIKPLNAVPSPETAFSRPLDGATAGTNTLEAFIDGGDTWKVAVNTMARSLALGHGAWHHLVGAFDGNALSMYVDGTPRGAPLVTGMAVYHNDDLLIGCDLNCGVQDHGLLGLVDDVRLYDHVLSTAEIAALAAM